MACINDAVGTGTMDNANLAGGLNAIVSIAGVGVVDNALINAIGVINDAISGLGSVNANINAKGNIAITLNASGSMSASIVALGNLISALQGSGTLTASGSLILYAVASINGIGSFTASVIGEEYMFATINGITTLSIDAIGIGSITSNNIQGNATLTANLMALANAVSSIIGSSTFTIADSTSLGEMSAAIILGASDPLSPEALAASLWNSIAANYNLAGTMGHELNAAGSGGDPWATNLPASYSGIQAGKILADLETLVKQVKSLTAANL